MISFDDKDGKPIGIQEHIGRRPIAAFGNSDGDEQMLEWTGAGKGTRLMMLVHHDDAEREFAYGAQSNSTRTGDACRSGPVLLGLITGLTRRWSGPMFRWKEQQRKAVTRSRYEKSSFLIDVGFRCNGGFLFRKQYKRRAESDNEGKRR